MIYIASGASRSGKSIIARRFLKSTLVPYMPLDCIMMGFMHGVPSMGIHDKLWPDEIAERMWPFLESVCTNMIANKIDYLFEGEAVLPERIKALSDAHPGLFKICFVGYCEADIDKKIADIKRYPNHTTDWLVSQPDAYIADHVANMKQYSMRVREDCSKYGLCYFDTSHDFENTVQKAFDFLKL